MVPSPSGTGEGRSAGTTSPPGGLPRYTVEKVPRAELRGELSDLPWRVLRDGLPARRFRTRKQAEDAIRYWRALGREAAGR